MVIIGYTEGRVSDLGSVHAIQGTLFISDGALITEMQVYMYSNL